MLYASNSEEDENVLKDIGFPSEDDILPTIDPTKKQKKKTKRGIIVFSFVCFMSLSGMYFDYGLVEEISYLLRIKINDGDEYYGNNARKMSKFEKLKIPTQNERNPYFPWDKRWHHHHHDKSDDAYPRGYLFHKPIRILALGGSVTWGGVLKNKYDAYPSLLADLHPDSTVDNMALRASGATFPSGCIQSMVEGEAFPEYEYLAKENRKHKVYDVILVEFSLNGIEGLDFLLYRLRQRYPNAIILYLHLHSFNPAPIPLTENQIRNFMDPIGGQFYIMPAIENVVDRNSDQQDKRSLFAADRHHLSEIGHKFVAEALVGMLSEHSLKSKDLLGSWGGGDQCYFWMNSYGSFPSDLEAEGGELRQFDPFLQKWAYEVDSGDAAKFKFLKHISYSNVGRGNEDQQNSRVPIYLVYMAKQSLYPSARVAVVDNFDTKNINADTYSYIDFEQNKDRWSDYHVTQSKIVGYASEGVNSIVVDSISKAQRPFRIVGIMLCNACEQWKSNVLEKFYLRLPEIKNINID